MNFSDGQADFTQTCSDGQLCSRGPVLGCVNGTEGIVTLCNRGGGGGGGRGGGRGGRGGRGGGRG